jgi:site-specific DNA-methyltransferase (adenine-specific)
MVTLLKGDCLKIMASLPDKSVDCFICDLPYGQLKRNAAKSEQDKWWYTPIMGCGWDIKIDIVEFWKQVKRLCKNDNTPVLMFCNTKFGNELINSNPSWFRYDLIWDKQRGVSFLSSNKMPMKSHEMVYVFSKKGAYYNRINIQDRCPLSVIVVPTAPARNQHPTEKPVSLYTWLLSRYVPPKGTVLDPTAGSFNSILAAKNLGYKAIGIEMDTTFFWRGVAKLK